MPALDLIRPSVTAMRVIASVNDGFARDFFLSGGKCEFHFPPPSIGAVLDESLCQYRNSGNDEEQEYRLRRRITHIRIGAEGAVINYKHGRHG